MAGFFRKNLVLSAASTAGYYVGKLIWDFSLPPSWARVLPEGLLAAVPVVAGVAAFLCGAGLFVMGYWYLNAKLEDMGL
ncbi:MAG: hypothetical protein V2A77_05945 [Pseudomonadota bacterium]